MNEGLTVTFEGALHLRTPEEVEALKRAEAEQEAEQE